VFDDFLQRRWLHPFRREWPRWGDLSGVLEQMAPSVDVVDRKKEVVVRAEVPGIDREDLDVSIVDRTLTIKGSSRHEEKKEEDDYFHHEIRSGTFSRSILLPADVNAAKAKASFKDGVVELHLPKVRASKRHKLSLT
jgi:HSP20 family protein